MWSIFKLSKDDSRSRLAAEVHRAFYTEIGRILVECNTTVELPEVDGDFIKRASLLDRLGFRSSSDVTQGHLMETSRLCAESEKRDRAATKAAAEYFSVKYPDYKFITESSVKNLCKMYGLTYETIDKYTGDVPDKNLDEIDRFRIDNKDYAYCKTDRFHGSDRFMGYISCNDVLRNDRYHFETAELTRFEMVAPRSLFSVRMPRVFNKGSEGVNAPIVLRPVIFKGVKYYLIVTAWVNE